MKIPLISVIVPVYNVEPFLKKCVNSIIGQTYTNLEIILIDDGSPDKCPEICDAYARKDNRIKVVHQENSGLAHVRNVGLENATGDYVTFVDSDDFVAPNYVEFLYKGIIENNADLSIASFTVCKENYVNISPVEEEKYIMVTKTQCMEYYTSLRLNPFISAWNKLYKRDLFDGITYPDGKLYEDAFTTYKLFEKAKKIVFTSTKLYYYRVNPQSILGQSFREKHLEMIEAFRSGMNFFNQKGENVIADMFLPPLLMREMYCWWGVKYVLKNKRMADEILDAYKKDCKKIKYEKNIGLIWLIIFKTVARFPWLYMMYRRLSPSYVGDRR